MRQVDSFAVVHTPATTSATNATQVHGFSTLGYKKANVYISVGTHATNGTTLASIVAAESDTVTSVTSMTGIPALSWSTTTSTSYYNAMPAVASIGKGGVIELQVDLRKRKKYFGVAITHGATTMNVGVVTVLSNAEQSDESTSARNVTELLLTTAVTSLHSSANL